MPQEEGFKMGAIPKFAPIYIVDGVVRDSDKVDFLDRETGVVRDNGRKVTVLTAQGFTEIKISAEDSSVPMPALGDRWIVFAELSEWVVNGRSGSTLTYAAPVTREHLADMMKALPETAKAN